MYCVFLCTVFSDMYCVFLCTVYSGMYCVFLCTVFSDMSLSEVKEVDATKVKQLNLLHIFGTFHIVGLSPNILEFRALPHVHALVHLSYHSGRILDKL